MFLHLLAQAWWLGSVHTAFPHEFSGKAMFLLQAFSFKVSHTPQQPFVFHLLLGLWCTSTFLWNAVLRSCNISLKQMSSKFESHMWILFYFNHAHELRAESMTCRVYKAPCREPHGERISSTKEVQGMLTDWSVTAHWKCITAHSPVVFVYRTSDFTLSCTNKLDLTTFVLLSYFELDTVYSCQKDCVMLL